MKILHVITSLRTGGAEKLMVDLLPRLRDAGHEVALCLFDGIRTPFYDEIVAKGIKVYDFGAGNSVYSLRNIFRLRRLMRSFDIVHTHNTSPQFFAALANVGLGKRLVTTEHNTHNRRRQWPGFAMVDRRMYGSYDTVICISDQAETNLRQFLGKSNVNITTIYNGVDVSHFANALPSGELDKIAPGSKKLIMVAAFRQQKDQKTLIEAMRQLPEDFHLFLVGEGDRMDECKTLSAGLGLTDRVHFMGRRSDIAELLKASDYVVMSSHYEGLSLSSVEGMSVGKPFIASDVDGLREVVKGYGVLFPHEDSEALVAEILKFGSDRMLYTSISNACLERARHFDISTMASQYSDIYIK